MYMRELNDYEKLYSLDVLGVEYRGENDQLRDFKESVVRKQDGRYEVDFPWIPGATLTNTNDALSRKRLENVERKLSRDEKLKGESVWKTCVLHATQANCKAEYSYDEGSHGV